MTSAVTLSKAILNLPVRLMALTNDPMMQIKMLLPLCQYQVSIVPSAAPIGQAEAILRESTAALCRLSALIALSRACSNWQPTSWDEAQQFRQQIADLFENEIIAAADRNNTETVNALRSLRATLLNQLSNAGGAAPHLQTVTRPRPLPALLLAQQLYADGNRSSELIQRASPIHPAFMPITFQALVS